jgi:hypothetical protein
VSFPERQVPNYVAFVFWIQTEEGILYDVLGGFPYNRINPEGNCLLSGLFQKLCIIRLQGVIIT